MDHRLQEPALTARPRPVPVTQRRRRPRVAAEDLRSRMLEAGRDLVYEMGVTITLEDLSMEDVIVQARVPRSSVYRLWKYKGDYVDDLLTYLAGPGHVGSSAHNQSVLDRARGLLDQHRDQLADPAGRREVLLEAVRVASRENLRHISESHRWQIYVALIATSAHSSREEDKRRTIARQLEQAELLFIEEMAKFYYEMFGSLGLRFKNPSYTYQHLATAGAGLLAGLALRRILAHSAHGDEPPREHPYAPLETLHTLIDGPLPGPSGAPHPDEWSLVAVSFTGIVDSFAEPDPDFDPLI